MYYQSRLPGSEEYYIDETADLQYDRGNWGHFFYNIYTWDIFDAQIVDSDLKTWMILYMCNDHPRSGHVDYQAPGIYVITRETDIKNLEKDTQKRIKEVLAEKFPEYSWK